MLVDSYKGLVVAVVVLDLAQLQLLPWLLDYDQELPFAGWDENMVAKESADVVHFAGTKNFKHHKNQIGSYVFKTYIFDCKVGGNIYVKEIPENDIFHLQRVEQTELHQDS